MECANCGRGFDEDEWEWSKADGENTAHCPDCGCKDVTTVVESVEWVAERGGM